MMRKPCALLLVIGLGLVALSASVDGCNRFCEAPDGGFVCCQTPKPTSPPHPGRCPPIYCPWKNGKPEGTIPKPRCEIDYECGSRHLKCCLVDCFGNTDCVSPV